METEFRGYIFPISPGRASFSFNIQSDLLTKEDTKVIFYIEHDLKSKGLVEYPIYIRCSLIKEEVICEIQEFLVEQKITGKHLKEGSNKRSILFRLTDKYRNDISNLEGELYFSIKLRN